MRSNLASSIGALTPRRGPANQTPPAPSESVFAAASVSIVAIRLPVCASRWVTVPSPLFSTQTPPYPAATVVGCRPTSMRETTRFAAGSIIATRPSGLDAPADPRGTRKIATSMATTSPATPATTSTQRGTLPTFRVYDLGVAKVLLGAAAFAVLAAALVATAGGASRSGPTYYRDVAPILDSKCASCHRLGGIAPFSLTSAGDARAHASGIVRMTRAGLMPPWMPGPDSAPIVGREHRRLTPTELQTLAAWSAAGAPAGNPSDRHSHPSAGAGLTGPGTTITLQPPRAYIPH